jgi:hypothetical protein
VTILAQAGVVTFFDRQGSPLTGLVGKPEVSENDCLPLITRP